MIRAEILTGKTQTDKSSRTRSVEREYCIKLSSNPQFAALSELCREIGEPEHVVAIAWTLAHPAVSCAIVGVRRTKHLEGLERAAELVLDEATMARLNEVFGINKGRPLQAGPAPEAYAW